jgi:hypothetical protein
MSAVSQMEPRLVARLWQPIKHHSVDDLNIIWLLGSKDQIAMTYFKASLIIAYKFNCKSEK